MLKILFFIIIFFLFTPAIFPQKVKLKDKTVHAKNEAHHTVSNMLILPGAYQTKEYLPMLKGKRVGIFANNTTMLGNTHLVDTLQKMSVTISKIFAPEHGFRGTADAGENVDNDTDKQTGVPIISLYGKKRKPSAEDLSNVDVLVFDIQDVGVRFYTYISSLQDFMESALEYNKPLIILDRPNPNGFYVDGPVLDTAFRGFIGMQSVPIVYGMTIGEYAKFLLGEKLLFNGNKNLVNTKLAQDPGGALKLTVIKCKNYTHKSKYILPEKPSPNLPDAGAIYWYPSTCLFEGTVLSEGRDTEKPFQIFGHPSLPDSLYAFTPVANTGASSPKLKDQRCYGWDISGSNEQILKKINNHIVLNYLMEAYKLFPDKENFFIKPKVVNSRSTNIFFNRLAGNATLMQQIIDGKTEKEIRASWEPGLTSFKKIRKKYLLYPDFDKL